MAQALFTDHVKNTGKNRQESQPIAKSAGLRALDGSPASPAAVMVMTEMGLNISNHRSRRLNTELVEWADVILTMQESHRREVMEKLMSRPKGLYIGSVQPDSAGLFLTPSVLKSNLPNNVPGK
jgi:protein-tyrosine-phosphatase